MSNKSTFEFLSNLLPKEIAQQSSRATTVMYVIGLLCVLKWSFRSVRFLYRLLLRPSVNLIQRYGANSWAVVTGASDGNSADGFDSSMMWEGVYTLTLSEYIVTLLLLNLG